MWCCSSKDPRSTINVSAIRLQFRSIFCIFQSLIIPMNFVSMRGSSLDAKETFTVRKMTPEHWQLLGERKGCFCGGCPLENEYQFSGLYFCESGATRNI